MTTDERIYDQAVRVHRASGQPFTKALAITAVPRFN
jgi:hypothetical protein